MASPTGRPQEAAPPPPAAGQPGITLVCPKCQARNPPSRRFCLSCSQPLFESTQTGQPAGIHHAPGQPWDCPGCGRHNSEETTTCLRCGFSLLDARHPAPAGGPSASAAPATVLVGCLALLILFIFGLIVAMRQL